MKRFINSILIVIIGLALSACGIGSQEESLLGESDLYKQDAAPVSEPVVDAIDVDIINTKGEKVGKATLTQETNGVKIKLTAENLPPGRHGFHIHETGSCEKPDFKSAGKHFNPFNRQHGFKNPKGPHAGDLPNIEADANGKVRTETFASLVTLEQGKPNSLLDVDGSALIIHENPDDYVTDPSGNSGNPIACGVIKR